MALTFLNHLSTSIFPIIMLASFVYLKCCHCFNPKLLNLSMSAATYYPNWSSAKATWYGSANGAGSDGGACGYLDAVERSPFSSMIAAGGPTIYQTSQGQGCGVCYEVKCTENEACSGDAVTVTITDSCPGCSSDPPQFDLSGTAFGALAKSRMADQLRNVGVLQLQYRKVKCNYPGVTVVVRVDQGSNPYYLATAIEYADGDGVAKVELQNKSGEWMTMEDGSGAVWALNAGYVLEPPFSLRLTEKDTQKSIVLNNVIPAGWKPGQTYRSHVNFDDGY